MLGELERSILIDWGSIASCNSSFPDLLADPNTVTIYFFGLLERCDFHAVKFALSP